MATAQKLARHGMSVAIVHRDRKGAMGAIEPKFEELRRTGVGFLALNLDALSTEGRKTSLDALTTSMGSSGKVRMLGVASLNRLPAYPNLPTMAEIADPAS